ncbi:hypothetical protein D3C84_829780 [compost metagenome]
MGVTALSQSRVLVAFGKFAKLGKYAKPDMVGWVFVHTSVVSIPVTDYACLGRLKVRLIVSNETTVKRRIELGQVCFNGFKNFDDVLASQLEHERDNPGFMN